MDQTPGDAADQQLVVNLELQGLVDTGFGLNKHVVKLLSLHNSPRETIKNEPTLAVRTLDILLD